MKVQKIVFLAIGMLITQWVWADTRSVEEALALAEAAGHGAAVVGRNGTSAPAFTLRGTKMLSDGVTPAFYVFNRAEKAGWTIVSAETGTNAILAYAEEGEMDWEHLSPSVQWWLNRYAAQIQVVREHPERAAAPAATTYADISPIIGTKWSQDDPYNIYCPSVGSSRCPTGCVATAIGQIMYLHKSPATGTGSHSYYWQTGSKYLSADFSTTNYEWSKMTPTYSTTSTTAAKQAVAKLLYHVGISCDMDYAVDGSGAQGEDVINALKTYFGYKNTTTSWELDNMRESQMLGNIQTELQAGRAVFITGYSWAAGQGLSGHAFVCEGMRNDGYVYINWGWGGMSDGYFDITVLDPDEQGTGGSSAGYQYYVTVWGGIMPANKMPDFDTQWTRAELTDSTAEAGILSLCLQSHSFVKGDTLGSSLTLSLPCNDPSSLQGTWFVSGGVATTGGERFTSPVQSGMITIQPADAGYTIYYQCHTSLLNLTDTITLSSNRVTAKRANGTRYTLTNQAIHALTIDEVVPYAEENLSRTTNGPVPAFVEGVVSRLIYSLSQVKSTGLHRFMMAGSTSYAGGVKDATYLNGANWTEADNATMSVGDSVVVFGPLRRWNTGQSIQEGATVVRLPNLPTALNEVQTSERATKFFRNGQLIIVRKGEEYNILGGKIQ